MPSERERTHAARHLPDDVPEGVKAARLQEVIAAFREGLESRFAAGAEGHKIVRPPLFPLIRLRRACFVTSCQSTVFAHILTRTRCASSGHCQRSLCCVDHVPKKPSSTA